jgi:hypothetical protein
MPDGCAGGHVNDARRREYRLRSPSSSDSAFHNKFQNRSWEGHLDNVRQNHGRRKSIHRLRPDQTRKVDTKPFQLEININRLWLVSKTLRFLCSEPPRNLDEPPLTLPTVHVRGSAAGFASTVSTVPIHSLEHAIDSLLKDLPRQIP